MNENEMFLVEALRTKLIRDETRIPRVWNRYLDECLLRSMPQLKRLYTPPSVNDLIQMVEDIIRLSKENVPELYDCLYSFDWKSVERCEKGDDVVRSILFMHLCEQLSLIMTDDDSVYPILSERWIRKVNDPKTYKNRGAFHIIKSLSIHHHGDRFKWQDDDYAHILLNINIIEALIKEYMGRGWKPNVEVGYSLLQSFVNKTKPHPNLIKTTLDADRKWFVLYWLWNISFVIRNFPNTFHRQFKLFIPQLLRKSTDEMVKYWTSERAYALQMSTICEYLDESLEGIYPTEQIADHAERHAKRFYDSTLESESSGSSEFTIELVIAIMNRLITTLMQIEYYFFD